LGDRPQIDKAALHSALGALQPLPAVPSTPSISLAADQDFYAARAAFGRQLIQSVLTEQAGNVDAAAQRLGLGRSTLYKKMATLGLSS
jgi:DNA-binding NtrC family response regulator